MYYSQPGVGIIIYKNPRQNLRNGTQNVAQFVTFYVHSNRWL